MEEKREKKTLEQEIDELEEEIEGYEIQLAKAEKENDYDMIKLIFGLITVSGNNLDKLLTLLLQQQQLQLQPQGNFIFYFIFYFYYYFPLNLIFLLINIL